MKTSHKDSECIPDVILKQAHSLINECRGSRLWYKRDGYMPVDGYGLLRAMRGIQKSGTREEYIKARNIELWLLQHFKKKSAA